MWSRSCILLLCVTQIVAADEPANESRSSSPEQRLAFAKMAAESYHFQVGNEQLSKVKLSPDPLLRWDNKVIREDDGFLFIWTENDKGRPVAAAQFFLVDKVWHHEFQSICTERFRASSILNGDRDWNWDPDRAGVDFIDASDLEAPGRSPAMRLRQMKAFVDRFSAAVDMNENFSTPEQLRLLTTPVYRYSSKEHNISDGAMFAFVQGTNPEILLLIEAEGSDASAKWKFGFARMSSYNLRVSRDQQIVWQKVREIVPTKNTNSTYFFRLAAQADGSADVKLAVSTKSVD